jgi:hypothetical protein
MFNPIDNVMRKISLLRDAGELLISGAVDRLAVRYVLRCPQRRLYFEKETIERIHPCRFDEQSLPIRGI